ncbi:DUF1850 domain-containing protein [Salibacterium salarium]|nr:DUF1850 domain-containing protein [Salibacterium salarium]
MLWTNNRGKEMTSSILHSMKASSGIFIIFTTLLVMISACEKEETHLVIQHEREGKTFMEIPIEIGDKVALSWVHSVEKTPWTDIFRIDKSCDFMLEETQFKSFGAGVEHEYEDLERRDGTFVAENIEECHNSVNWIHSHDAEYEVKVNQEVVAETGDLPHHVPLKILIEEG